MGRFLNRNYSGYLVPTSADIPKLDVVFVGDFDVEASPIGVFREIERCHLLLKIPSRH
jgi:CO/xanthine dehydrogenase Mo-binding subunit